MDLFECVEIACESTILSESERICVNHSESEWICTKLDGYVLIFMNLC